jgi:DNA invertase Pin-like site-specific DNA recombinase
MLVGYMRVSSDNDRQTTALQRDALLDAGVDPPRRPSRVA